MNIDVSQDKKLITTNREFEEACKKVLTKAREDHERLMNESVPTFAKIFDSSLNYPRR